MTAEELFNLDKVDLEKLSDNEWRAILTPYLPRTRPEHAPKKSEVIERKVPMTSKKRSLDVTAAMRVVMRKQDLKSAGADAETITMTVRSEFGQYDLSTLGL